MATTYKILSAALTDGAAYIDLPISGRITSIAFSLYATAGAATPGYLTVEVSRVAVNQVAVNNPRGVVGVATLASAAASQAISANTAIFPDEPVKSGERLYLNCAAWSNMATCQVIAMVTIA